MRPNRSTSLRSIVHERTRRPLFNDPQRRLLAQASTQDTFGPPPPYGRLSRPHGLAELGRQTASTWPEGAIRSQRNIEARVAPEFFPLTDSPCSTFVAFVAMQFAVQTVAERQQDAQLAGILRDFAAALHDAAIFYIAAYRHLDEKDPHKRQEWIDGAVRGYLQRLLRANSAVIFPGGFVNDDMGHAACLLFMPQNNDTTLCAIIDRRMDVARYPRDGKHRPQPIIIRFPTYLIATRVGAEALKGVLEQQFQAATNSIEGFDNAVEALIRRCNGEVLLGFDRSNALQVKAWIPGQSTQKTGTCTVSSLLGALHFVLHRQLGTLHLRTSPPERDRVQAIYKQVKQMCRRVILEQALDASQGATGAGKEAIEASLKGIRTYLEARQDIERKGARPLLELMEAGVKTA